MLLQMGGNEGSPRMFRAAGHHPSFGIQRDLAGAKPADGLGIDLVLFFQHSCSKRVRGVVAQHGYSRLNNDGAMIEIGRHKMHGAAMYLHPVLQRTFMRMHTGIGRQQGRMNIEQPAMIAIDKLFGEDAHKAGQYHEIGLVTVYDFRQRNIECRAVGIVAVSYHTRRNAVLFLRSPDLARRHGY